jgi:hypothetical protein
MIPMSIMRALVALTVLVASAGPLAAQTDFYNTDRGRPLTVEDAIVVERHAFELQAAPLRATRVSRGVTHWGVAPELAWGILPRTQVEIALPVVMQEEPGRDKPLMALAGVELEALHQLNAETMGLPALAVGAAVHLRAGPLAPRRAVTTLRALATRTLGWGRVHLNAGYAPGAALEASDPGAADADRWMGGLAVDHTFALRSMLVGADVSARESLGDDGQVEWSAGVGVRQQMGPRFAMDAGVNRRVSGGLPGWGLTVGGAYAFAPPGMRRFGGRDGVR